MSRKNPKEIRIKSNIDVKPDGVFIGKVIKSGNGAVISFFKRFLGKDVVIIIVDKINKPKHSKKDNERAGRDLGEFLSFEKP